MFSKNQPTQNHKSIETIIGPSVKVQGDFQGEGDLVIEGILMGSLETKNNLKVGQNAIVEAGIKAKNAFISGKVKGNISVKGKLEITGTAIVLGDIKAQILSIESGALLKGNINMPVSKFSAQDELPVNPTEEVEVSVEEVEEK